MDSYIVCSVDGCDNQHQAKGLCTAHYRRWRKHGDPARGGPIKKKRQGCKVEGCKNKHCGYGYCQNHLKKLRKYGDAEAYHPKYKCGVEWIEQNKNHSGDECLRWPFSVSSHGRGMVQIDGKQISAPRAMCMAAHGSPSDERLQAAHTCGKGHEGCMNPRHLRWATGAENSADRETHGTSRKGTQVNTNKLSEDDVREIRRRRASESGAALAREFGVSASMICDIHKRKSWKWLE